MEQNRIRHAGTVSAISDRTVTVTILQMAACSACQAKRICRISESKQKEIQVTVPNPQEFRIGQPVNVEGKESQGMKAVLLAFGIPLILLMSFLIAVLKISGNELTAAVVAIGVLIPYYIVLFLFRDRLVKDFQFTIEEGK